MQQKKVGDIEPKLWILKSKGEESSFGGNKGYPDNPVSEYVYDTNVPNHSKIKARDWVVIADKKYIKGYAIITSVEMRQNVSKTLYICPECTIHEHYERKTKEPRYRCRNKHEFNTPDERQITVNEFTAYYGTTFIPAESETSVKIIDPYYLNRNTYYSIQQADLRFFERELPDISVTFQRTKIKPTQSLASADKAPPYIVNHSDQRGRRKRDVVERKGQITFKKDLISYYGVQCMATGCDTARAIEASHICPYRGEKDNNVRNGLLLRADLHKLFDADLLGINPDTLVIELHHSIQTLYYKKYEGKALQLSRNDFAPSAEALQYRWNLFMKNKNKSHQVKLK